MFRLFNGCLFNLYKSRIICFCIHLYLMKFEKKNTRQGLEAWFNQERTLHLASIYI